MDPYCRGCAYRQKFEGGGTICGYAVITDHLRGCPAGAGCTHKTSERPAHKNIAVIGHDKQVHAEAQHRYYLRHKKEILTRTKKKAARDCNHGAVETKYLHRHYTAENGVCQMFKVTMTNLGRTHAAETQTLAHAPDGDDLYCLASKHLLSSDIRFSIHAGDPDAGNYPVAGSVLAGAHHVGDFKVEEVAR